MRILQITLLSLLLSACAQQLTGPQAPKGSKTGAVAATSRDSQKTKPSDHTLAAMTKQSSAHVVEGGKNALGSNLSENPANNLANNNEPAYIIFLRSSLVASAESAQIYDVSSMPPRYVGEIANNTQLHHNLAPGTYTFMLIADSVDYLVVNVDVGYSYYAVVKPSMGLWKPKFTFVPIKSSEFSDSASSAKGFLYFGQQEAEALLKAMTPIVNSKEFTGLRGDISVVENRYQDTFPHWQEEQQGSSQRKTLDASDGRQVFD